MGSLNNEQRDWRAHPCSSCVNTNNSFEAIDITSSGYEDSIDGSDYITFNYTLPEGVFDGYTYSAVFIEAEIILITNGGPSSKATTNSSMRITSDTNIVPAAYPYPSCPPNVCACGWECGDQYQSSSSGSDSTDAKVWIIVGVVVGVALLVLVILAAGGFGWYYFRQRGRQGYDVL